MFLLHGCHKLWILKFLDFSLTKFLIFPDHLFLIAGTSWQRNDNCSKQKQPCSIFFNSAQIIQVCWGGHTANGKRNAPSCFFMQRLSFPPLVYIYHHFP